MSTDTARDCARLICDGALSSESLVQQHLSLIDSTDESIGAWAHLDAEYALRQATAMDQIRKHGQPVGALHGVPVGVKDIFDSKDLPTERGSSIFAGRQPTQDCAVIEKLREAGAVLMGKTVTTEVAFMHPAKTTNPHDATRSPGGSSSGSAAAVAAGHVPLAIGSQTNGSVIRPASFCGIYGFKPSAGIISRRGALETSNTLDQVGVFARDIADLALLVDVLSGFDTQDDASFLRPRPRMLDGYLSEAPVEPALAWIDLPYSDRYSESAAAGFEELLQTLGKSVERIPAPASFSALLPCHKIIHEYEIVRCLEHACGEQMDQLSDTIKPTLLAARRHTDAQYQEALEIRTAAIDWFKRFFYDYDAIVTPSALGEPVHMQDGTGDPVCCTIWTLCGLPSIGLPLLSGEHDLPVGVQLVGALHEDDRLLRTTRHIMAALHESDD